MPDSNLENWMHASDSERNDLHSAWNVNNDEGKNIADSVAKLFADECIYNVQQVTLSKHDNKWVIKAYVESADYENLKNRYNIDFLGFKIDFNDISNYSG